MTNHAPLAVSGSSDRLRDQTVTSGDKDAKALEYQIEQRLVYYRALHHRLSEVRRGVRLAKDGSHWQSPATIAAERAIQSAVVTAVRLSLRLDAAREAGVGG